MLLESIMIGALVGAIITAVVIVLLIFLNKRKKINDDCQKKEAVERKKDREAFEVLNPIGCYFDEEKFRVLFRERKSLSIELLVEEFNIDEISDKLNNICKLEEKEKDFNHPTNGTSVIVENHKAYKIKQITDKCDIKFVAKRINEENYCYFSIPSRYALNNFLSELEKMKKLDRAKGRRRPIDEQIKLVEEKSKEINRNARVEEKDVEHKKNKERSR